MREPKSLVSTEQLAAALGQPALRVYDARPISSAAAGQRRPVHRRARPQDLRGGAYPRRRLPRPAGGVLRPDHAPALHDAGDRAARSGLRPSRLGGGARVVLYSIGSMMWATRFWWMLRSLGFDGAAVLDGGFDKWRAEGRPTRAARSGVSSDHVQGEAAPGPVRRQARGAGRNQGSEHRDRQCAWAPVPQGPGAQPVRPPGAGPGKRQCPRGDAGGPAEKDSPRCPTPSEVQRSGRHQGQAHDLLSEAGSRPRSISRGGPARLRRPDALRRLHGGVGEGPVAARRDRLTRRRGPASRARGRSCRFRSRSGGTQLERGEGSSCEAAPEGSRRGVLSVR